MTDIEIIRNYLDAMHRYEMGMDTKPNIDWLDEAIRALDRLSAAPGESAKQFHPVEDGSGTLVRPLNPPGESARELLDKLRPHIGAITCPPPIQEHTKMALALIESSWARVREDYAKSIALSPEKIDKLAENIGWLFHELLDPRRINHPTEEDEKRAVDGAKEYLRAILAQPKEESHE